MSAAAVRVQTRAVVARDQDRSGWWRDAPEKGND
jgi:hypothetical protein